MSIRILNNDSTRGYPRCKNHGTFSTLAQVEAFLTSHNVSSGYPTDIMIGDIFTLQVSSSVSYTVWIAGINTEVYKGNDKLSTRHISCIADFGYSAMNSTDTTVYGYNGATSMQTFLDAKATELSSICGSHLLSRKVILSNAVTGGAAAGWGWYSKQLTLLSEIQLFGSIQWGNSFDIGDGFEKLPIFNNLNPLAMFGREDIWLRAVHSSTEFSCLHHHGYAAYYPASTGFKAVALFCLG
jgi:hypothetical protein